jgi:hypothetical protein
MITSVGGRTGIRIASTSTSNARSSTGRSTGPPFRRWANGGPNSSRAEAARFSA